MTQQDALFEQEPHYCVDTNVIISFLVESDNEPYGRDVFGAQWAFFEGLVRSGRVVAPRQVERELAKWTKHHPEVGDWVKAHRFMFRDVTSRAQLMMAKMIVNEYPVYGTTLNFLGDLEVMTLAHSLAVPVITSERDTNNPKPSRRRPKIPNVCREFGIPCLTFPGFLRKEGFRT